TAGLFTTIGINAALYQRAQTGLGTKIDVAMLDCQIAILENAIARYFATGQVPGPMGARHPSITPFEVFATGDGYMVIAAGNDGLFRRLAESLNEPGLAEDERFASNDARTRNVEALKAELESRLAARTTAEWITALEAAGVPCSPINTVADALADPQVLHRNMVVSVEDPVAGTVRMAGNPIKISGMPDATTRPPAPDLDGDRAAILADLARLEAN
ncbi:MAG: CoA transferase, partial [Alphaproteobacteria bacterium]|nr:CoA transferase [Alphaproteobacteria bacterium]